MDLPTAMARPWSGARHATTEETPAAAEATAEEWLRRFANGDDEAFSRLVAQIGDRLYAFICRFLGDPHKTEDVYQTVLVKVALHAREFDHRSLFSTWLYRIARNACIDVLRHDRRQSAAPLGSRPANGESEDAGDDEPAANAPLPDEQASSAELAQIISAAVARLPEEQRDVFLLREEADLTFDQIGEMLGCGKETAKSRMRYALRHLQTALSHEARLYGISQGKSHES